MHDTLLAKSNSILVCLGLTFSCALGCADEPELDTATAASGTSNDSDSMGDGDGDPTGDGDGDPTGDGDGDPTGDGDGDPTGDGDGDPTGDGDGDPGSQPEVHQDSTYSVSVTTLTYGQGMTHSDWGGPSNGTIDLELDLYEPMDAPPGRPAMVVVHGGGFTGGSKTAMAYTALAEYFAERGWVTMSINYRIADDRGTVPDGWADFVANNDNIPANAKDQMYAQYPASRDTKAAVRWLYANAETYQVDLDYVTAAGGSAGAILSVMLGVSSPEDFRDEIDEADDPTLSTTNLDQSSEVHTILDHWGAATPLEILEAIDGIDRFDATDAPINIVHGTEDPTVPIEAGEALRDAYIETGVPYAYHPLEGAGHGAWEETVDGMTLHELAFEFIVEQQGLIVLP